jgi:sulfur carrier protein ThiS
LRLRDKEYEVEAGMTVRDAMLRNGIQPDSVIPTRNGELITDDEILQDGERIRLVAVISGGAPGETGIPEAGRARSRRCPGLTAPVHAASRGREQAR